MEGDSSQNLHGIFDLYKSVQDSKRLKNKLWFFYLI